MTWTNGHGANKAPWRCAGRVAAASALGMCVVLAAMPILSGAQAPASIGETCAPVLRQDQRQTLTSEYRQWAYFLSIDQTEFQQLKSGLSLGFSIPIVGDIVKFVKGFADYSSFDESRRAYAERRNVTMTSQEARSAIEIATNPVAYPAWNKCIRDLAMTRQAVVIYKDQEDSTTVHVQIANNTPVALKLSSTLVNGKVDGAPPGKLFKDHTLGPAASKGWLILRVGPGPLKVSVNTDRGYPVEPIVSNWQPEPPVFLRGQLVITMPDPTLQPRGEVPGEAHTTPDLHNRRCDFWNSVGGVVLKVKAQSEGWSTTCTPGTDWAAVSRTLTVAESRPGYVISGAHPHCVTGACEWNASFPKPCQTAPDSRSATCTILAGSGPTTYDIRAQAFESPQAGVPQMPVQKLLFGNARNVTLEAPADAKAAAFKFTTSAGDDALTPGDAKSNAGTCVLLGSTTNAAGKLYTYRCG